MRKFRDLQRETQTESRNTVAAFAFRLCKMNVCVYFNNYKNQHRNYFLRYQFFPTVEMILDGSDFPQTILEIQGETKIIGRIFEMTEKTLYLHCI